MSIASNLPPGLSSSHPNLAGPTDVEEEIIEEVYRDFRPDCDCTVVAERDETGSCVKCFNEQIDDAVNDALESFYNEDDLP